MAMSRRKWTPQRACCLSEDLPLISAGPRCPASIPAEMIYVSLLVEILRSRPRLVFWMATLAQATLWILVPALFYSAPPGDVAEVLARGHDFGLEHGPPLAYWLAEIAFV